MHPCMTPACSFPNMVSVVSAPLDPWSWRCNSLLHTALPLWTHSQSSARLSFATEYLALLEGTAKRKAVFPKPISYRWRIRTQSAYSESVHSSNPSDEGRNTKW